jgi:hypothetical protein
VACTPAGGVGVEVSWAGLEQVKAARPSRHAAKRTARVVFIF